jgi:cellobiose-specific phosphotransferase system component IIA
MAEIYQLPDNQGNNNGGLGNIPFSIPIGGFGVGNGFGFGGNGFGMNGIYDLLGVAIIASLFGWGGNGFGGNGFGGAGGAGFISNQLNNDSGRELIMNAITNQGEASRTAIQTLSTMLGQDFNLTNAGIQSAQNTLNQIANQLGMSTLQMINAVQSGDANVISTLQSCCCQTQKQIMEQGYQSQIATLNQTNQLGSQADRNTNSLLNAINAQTVAMNDQFCAARERDMQAKIDTQADIITQLRGQIDNANQTAQITGYVNSLIAPLQAKVTEIADKQLPTVPVQWPQIQAVNTTPYMGGFNGFYGNGFGNNIVF